jgi:hypothetical protein
LSENYKLCPFCKKGELRIHSIVISGDTDNNPIGESNQLICDICSHTLYDKKLFERIVISDSVIAVTKPDDLERIMNNPKICTYCEKEKRAVYSDEKIKLCKECFDSIMGQFKK